MSPAEWATAHLGEWAIRQAVDWHMMETDSGIVFGRDAVNVAVDVTAEGWWLRLYLVSPAGRWLLDEWQVPAIHVCGAFLTLLDRVSEPA